MARNNRATFMRNRLAAILLSALLTGCATGPKHSEIKDTIPALNPALGRIYFYRASVLGAAIQPTFQLNGEAVGEMVPQGFFYVDRHPGSYLVSAKTESTATLQFVLEARQTRYVRGHLNIGFLVGRPAIQLIEERIALQELQNLSYVPSPAMSPVGAAPAFAPAHAPAPAAQGAPAAAGSMNLKDLEGLLPPAESGKKP